MIDRRFDANHPQSLASKKVFPKKLSMGFHRHINPAELGNVPSSLLEKNEAETNYEIHKNKDFQKGEEATCAVFVDHRQLLPFEERHHVQDGPGDGGVLGVEVDEERVLVVHGRVLPAGLYVRDLQGVADGLDGTDRRAVGGTEHCDHAESQLVTHCSGRGNRSCA